MSAGTEALFADMGHFNRPSIQLSTLFLVYPALMLTYLGQVGCLHYGSPIIVILRGLIAPAMHSPSSSCKSSSADLHTSEAVELRPWQGCRRPTAS